MFEIEDLFELDLLQEGLFNSGSEFKEFVSGADDETIYGLVKEGVFESLEDFQSQVNLKKKEEELPGTGDEGDTDADTTTPSVGDGSSDTSPVTPESNLLNRTVQDVNPEDVPTEEVEEVVVEQEDVIPPVVEQEEQTVVQGADELTLTPEEAQARLDNLLQAGDDVTVSTSITDGKEESGEDETWLEESWLGQALDWAFDDVPILGVLSADFWGDMYRAIGNGFTKGQSVDEAIELFAKGKNISDSDLQEYIQAVKRSDGVAMSDEMKSFQKIYEDNGGGFLGFILGFGSNLSIAPELLIDSFSSMLNPASVAAAGVGAGTGAATGAALTAVSGPGALFGAGAGAVGGAFGGASLALEFGMSYTEFMKEEVESKGGKFDAEGIRLVLEDPEALQRIRNKAATRGIAIGMIDAITAGVAGKVVGTTGKVIAKGTAKQLAKAGKGAVTKNAVQKGVEVAARYGKRIAPVASGLGVEIGGGSLGEATARALAGQEMDIAEIGLEGFAGAGSAPITLARGAFITPQYRLGKDFVTKDYILATIGTATPQQIADMDIDITNDPDLKAVVTDIKAESQFALEIEKTYPMIPDGEAKSEIIKLQIERSKLPDTASETTKLRKRQIDQRIAEIVDDYSQVMTEEVRVEQDGNTFSEVITVTKGDAKKQLAKDGIEDPTQRQISDMQKALMEREKSRDRSAEKALADAEAEAQAQAEALVTDQEVMDRLNETGTVYTDQEFSNVKKILIKEKKDAIQKSSTEGVDVQESSRDGEGVGEGNIQQEATQEGNQEAQTKETKKIAEKEKAEVVETKRVEDYDVILKEETFTITDEFGAKSVITVETNLDGSLRKALVENFDENGNSTRGEFVKLADNDIVVRDGLTAEQLLTQRLQEGEVIEKTSEKSGNEIINPKKIARLTTDQKQKLGIETETQGVDKQSRIDSAPKIFGKSHTDKKLPYGKAVISDITSPDSKGVQTAKYNNPQTGELDVIISSSGDSANFVGFTRVYENGKPTNQFTAKMESTGDAFKNMITEAENALPDGAEVIEVTTISIGGLKTYNKSKTLSEKVDADGNVVTKTTKYSDATQQSVKEKGNEAAFSAFQTDDKAKAEAEVDKIKKAYPGIDVKIKRRGSKRGKKTYTIDLELPVLVKTPKAPKNFQTIPPSQRKGGPQVFRVPGSRTVDVQLNEDGTVQAINRKTGRPLKKIPKKIERFILETVVDVNEGKKADLEGVSNPREVDQRIIDTSENPKEVADAISALKNEEQTQLEARDLEFGLDALINKTKKGAAPVVKFTPESWKRVTGLSPRESGVSSIWIASKERGGVSLEDGYLSYVTDPDQIAVDVEITPSEVAEFVKANPNKEAMNALKLDAESSTLADLRLKFTELTGMPATDANIDVVNKIDPDRAPNVDVQQQSQERLEKQSTEPGIFGKKRGPSAKRITQGKNKKTVEVNDSKALAEQIRLESKAARESETAYRKSQRKVLDLISSLKTRGIIKSKQSLVMTRKVLSTNYSSDVQVKKLVDYVTKVMDDASINQTIKDIQTAIGNPKKNGVKYNIRKGKFGANSDALVDVLTALADADISNIPLEKLNATKQLLEFYGKRGKLEFTNIGGDLKTGLDILNSMDKSMEQNIDLEAEGKKKKKKKTKQYDVAKAISEIKTKKPDLSKLTDDNDIEIAKQFRNLTREDIKSLIKEKDGEFDYSNLETLRVVMQNLTQGVVNVDTNNVLNEIISNRASKPVSSVVKKVTKNGILKHFKNVSSSIKLALTNSRSGKNLILDKIRSNVATAVDNAFGNLNSTVIYDNTFGKLAKASENMNVFISKIRAEVDTARNLLETDGVNKVRKFLGGRNTDNKVVKKAYKLRLLQLTREYLNNFVDGEPNPKAPNPKDFLDLTIKDIRNKKGTQQLSELDAKTLESLQKEFTVDGEISLEKLEKSLTKNEKKALKILDAQNAKLAPLSKFTSGVLRGNRVELYNSYSHRVVLRSGVDQNADLTQRGKEYSQASTKGGANLSRTKGAKPISFDPFYSLERGSTEVALDYFMTNEVRRVKKTINKVTAEIDADPNSTDAQKSAVSALDKSVTEILEVTFGEQLRDVSFLGNFANKVKRIAYQAILGSVTRMGSEIITNMSMIIADPKAAARGFSEFSKLSFLSRKEGTDILNNLGSRMTTRLFDTKSLSSRFADMTGFFQSTPSDGTARGRVANIMGIIMRMGIKQTAAVADKIAGTIISFPDKSLSIPMWYGKFATTFEAETGIKLTSKDLKEIGKGESKYLGDKYKAAIAEATRKADQTATMVGTSKNSFDTVIKNQYRQTGKGGGGMLNAYRAANKFMANFSLFEYATARFAVGALQRRGDISRTQALGILAGVGMRMTMYPILYAALSQAFDDELFGTDTEEDESDIEDIITRQVVGTMLTLMTRKSMGNIPNLVPSMLIEQFNEQALEGLRNGEDYNPYKHSIVYNQLSLDNIEDKGLTRTAVGIMAGPYGPIIKTLERMTDLSFRSVNNRTEESKEKNKKELTDRMVLELLGNSGLVPFYKDIRRIIIKDMFEDQRKSEQRRKEEKEYKEYLEFLKENDPGTYREELRNKANDSFEGEYFEDNNFDPSEWE